MMRSLYSGVSGLRTHQTKMDVIGNNIANVNTVGYKTQTVSFRDLMYQTTQKASGANANGLAGTNAKQMGLGSTVGAINTSITQQGSAQTTNNPWDIMISGDAFFVVSNGQSNYFTRDGSFYVDGQGNLAMSSNGYKVMGWAPDPATGQPNPNELTALQIMSDTNQTYPAEATSDVRITGILDSFDTKVNSTSGRGITMDFYDNRGNKYYAKLSIHSTTTDGSFYVKLDEVTDSKGNPVPDDIKNSITFGNQLNVAVSKAYTLVNGTSEAAAASPFKLTTSAGTYNGTVGTEVTTAAVTPADLAVLQSAYKNIDFTKVDKFTILPSGELQVTAIPAGSTTPAVGDKAAPLKGSFAPENVTVTSGAISKSFKVGDPQTVAGMNQADKDQIKALYGLDVDAEGVVSFKVNADGSLTVTEQTVQNAASLVFNANGKGELISVNGNGEGMMTLGFSGNGKFSDINIDFSSMVNANNNGSSTTTSVKGKEGGLGAGRPIGELDTIGIDQNGIITATYTNGMSRCLGQIAVAQFANASGLEKMGDNLYSATMNSGDFNGMGMAIGDTGGKMNAGVLEMSNVDLAAEFTEMITTQRGFQANSRIITTSDTMLEELTNLKR